MAEMGMPLPPNTLPMMTRTGQFGHWMFLTGDALI
jgi:hypothetical protein